jgi:hypothetical protein
MNDLHRAEREPCEGRVCSGSGCSHERAAAELTAHDQAIGLYDDVTAQVDKAISDAQQLDDWKQRVVQELSEQGHDVDGAAVTVAHALDEEPRIDDVGTARGTKEQS